METLWNVSFILLAPIIMFLRIVIYSKNKLFNKKIKFINKKLENQLSINWKEKGGYIAGYSHYANVWTRDSFFALMAPIIERENRLRTFCNRLKKDIKKGHIPFTYNEIYYTPSLLFNYVLKRRRAIPKYRDEKYNNLVMDSNSQYIIMVHEAYKINKDKEWLKSHLNSIKKAIDWYDNYLHNELIYEKPFGSWEDTLLLKGNISYTNILYLEALKRAHKLFRYLEIDSDYYNKYRNIYDKIINLIIEEKDIVSISLAALWDNNIKINNLIKKIVNDKNDSMIRNRNIENEKKSMLAVNIIGQGEYHKNWRWSWVGCLWCIVLAKKGYISESVNLFKRYKKKYMKYGTIHEVYDHINEEPINIAFYKSEGRFSEGIGLYLLAEKTLKNL